MNLTTKGADIAKARTVRVAKPVNRANDLALRSDIYRRKGLVRSGDLPPVSTHRE